MNSRRVRCGRCSVCNVAMESPGGTPDRAVAVPRSKALRQQGHHHKKEWHVVPDIEEHDTPDGAADCLPWFAR